MVKQILRCTLLVMALIFTSCGVHNALLSSVGLRYKIQSPHPDLDVEITRCVNANGMVLIDMVITNESSAAADILFSARNITIYDDEGNSYNSNNSRILFGFPNMSLETQKSFSFPQDIPLKFRLQVDAISGKASKLSLINVGLSSGGSMALTPSKPLTIKRLKWDE